MRTLTLLFLATLKIHAPEEIARLDHAIQSRFLIPGPFGMQRILPNHSVRMFEPLNSTEWAVVGELRQKNYEVAIYLAGRGILAELPAMLPISRSVVQGPAFITEVGAELPGPAALLDEGRRALLAFQKGDGYDIRKGEWTIAMRPLRATSERCVQCHNARGANVKLGDPLGVAMYVYRHASN